MWSILFDHFINQSLHSHFYWNLFCVEISVRVLYYITHISSFNTHILLDHNKIFYTILHLSVMLNSMYGFFNH